jgi:hypothetical protein
MKYFTVDLIRRLNSNDEDVVDEADREWEKNLKEYQEYIESINNIIPQDLIGLDLHDFVVELISLRNEPQTGILCCEISCRYQATRYNLIYEDVKTFTINAGYSLQGPFYKTEKNCIGDWIADEISLSDTSVFRHEILLGLENHIICEFKNFYRQTPPVSG